MRAAPPTAVTVIPHYLSRHRRSPGGADVCRSYAWGTVAPFVAYLAEREELSDDEVAEFEALVARLQDRHKDRRRKP